MGKYAYASIRLPKSGYQQVNLQLRNDYRLYAKKWMNNIPAVYFETIFKHHHKPIGEDEVMEIQDTKRLQVVGEAFLEAIENKEWWRHLNNQLQVQLDFIFDGLEIVYWSVLWSKKGGVEQSMHTDFTIHDTWVRISGIIALEKNTKLVVATLNKEGDDDKKVITLNIGDVVILQGDQMHAGASYSSDNKRLFFKAIPIGHKLLKGEYDSVGYCYVCENDITGGCKKKFPTQNILDNHRYYCKAVHGEEEVNRRRKNNRQQSEKRRKLLKGEI